MCCADLSLAYAEAHAAAAAGRTASRDLSPFVVAGDGLSRVELAVEGVRCAACMRAIEDGLGALPGIVKARLNFTDRRLAVEWRGGLDLGSDPAKLDALGFKRPSLRPEPPRSCGGAVRRSASSGRLAVAGFASMNVMLMAVSVWAGNVSDITPETRDLFHWMQALIALPAAAYAGRPFYESAFRGLRAGRVNMDFPITLGIVLSLSCRWSRPRPERSTPTSIAPSCCCSSSSSGAPSTRPCAAAPERLPRTSRRFAARRPPRSFRTAACARRRSRPSSPAIACWCARASGSPSTGSWRRARPRSTRASSPARPPSCRSGRGRLSTPARSTPAARSRFGSRPPVRARSSTRSRRLMARALETKSKALLLADKATRLYVPLVHAAAALTALGWLLAGAGWHAAALDAVAVLIVTCPCAFGLAIPAVQVAAAGALFRDGVLLNGGDALERLAEVDTVVFDKTGTLTLPEPRLVGDAENLDTLETAARLALSSRHPLASALAEAARRREAFRRAAGGSRGSASVAVVDGVESRLGSARFCGAEREAAAALASVPGSLRDLLPPRRDGLGLPGPAGPAPGRRRDGRGAASAGFRVIDPLGRPPRRRRRCGRGASASPSGRAERHARPRRSPASRR